MYRVFTVIVGNKDKISSDKIVRRLLCVPPSFFLNGFLWISNFIYDTATAVMLTIINWYFVEIVWKVILLETLRITQLHERRYIRCVCCWNYRNWKYTVETTENVSCKILKWEKLHFNIFENSCFHMKVLYCTSMNNHSSHPMMIFRLFSNVSYVIRHLGYT